MALAKNDIERALRDVLRARQYDEPDFIYRVRLAAGHLVEALDALNAYSQEYHDEVDGLLRQVSAEGQEKLKVARGTLENVGSKALKHLRNNTFHYPSPRRNYNPTSDKDLELALGEMTDRRALVFVDFGSRQVTHTFADELASALAMGKHSPREDEFRKQLEVARDGSFAFMRWADELVLAYFDATGVEPGTPEPQ